MLEELPIIYPHNSQYCVVPGFDANLIFSRIAPPRENPKHIKLAELSYQPDLINTPVDPACLILEAVSTHPVENVTVALGFRESDGSPIFVPDQTQYCKACTEAENCIYSYEGMHRRLLPYQIEANKSKHPFEYILLALYNKLGHVITANQIAAEIGSSSEAIRANLSRSRPNCINGFKGIHGGYEMPEAPLKKCVECPLQQSCSLSRFLKANK